MNGLLIKLQPRGESGIAMLEFIVVFPVLLLFFLGLMDFTVTLTSKSILNAAAQRAAQQLAASPTIDNSCSSCTFPAEPENCSAEKAACVARRTDEEGKGRNVALWLPLATPFFTSSADRLGSLHAFIDPNTGVEIVLPTAATREEAYQKQPIIVRLKAHRTPLLNFLPGLGDISAEAVAWKELSKFSASPTALDCNGQPMVNGANADGGKPANCGCVNSNDPNKEPLVVNGQSSNLCTCRGTLVPASGGTPDSVVDPGAACVCPAGLVGPIDASFNCRCPECPNGQIRDANASGCACTRCSYNETSNADHTQCVLCPRCPAPQMIKNAWNNGGECGCQTCPKNMATQFYPGVNCNPCPARQIASAANPTVCVDCPACPSGKILVADGNGCQCMTCPDGQYAGKQYETNLAICATCPKGQMPNAARDGCVACGTCGAGQVATGGSGTVPGVGTGGSCSCSPCQYPWVPAADGLNCTACPQGKIPNANQSGCNDCPTCGAGQRKYPITNTTPWTCSCQNCAAGSVGDGNVCTVCLPGTTPNAAKTACVSCPACPAGQIKTGNGTSCSCTSCGTGSAPDAGQTACVACSANQISQNGQCQDCPSCNYGQSVVTVGNVCACQCPTGMSLGQCKDTGQTQCVTSRFCNGAGVCNCAPGAGGPPEG